MKPNGAIELIGIANEISFCPKSAEFGLAEFLFCPVWKLRYPWRERRIVACYITRLQQVGHGETYVVRGSCDSLYLGSHTSQGVSHPWPWQTFYCIEHRTQAIEVYVPPEATKLVLQAMSSLMATFGK